jgi:hypothetical protein
MLTYFRTNNSKVITNALVNKFGNNTVEASHISIDKQLKPLLMKSYENVTAFNLSKCNNLEGCPVWYRSIFSLIPTLSIIGNVSKSTGILMLNGDVLADIYAWLEAHSGLSHSYVTTTAPTIGANTSSLNTSTTPSNSASK